jgi:hypothetical protein
MAPAMEAASDQRGPSRGRQERFVHQIVIDGLRDAARSGSSTTQLCTDCVTARAPAFRSRDAASVFALRLEEPPDSLFEVVGSTSQAVDDWKTETRRRR